ncbi:Unknown protein, partial [Striga hermonthica]
SVGSAKELWAALEKKYKTEDAGVKKFVVGKFLEFKMVDTKTVVSQVQDFHLILHDIHAEGMSLSESFQVAAVIEKLPPGWKDFKNYLKHKRKEMSLEDLVVRLWIKEDNRKSSGKAPMMKARANLLEQGNSRKRKPLSKGKQQPAKLWKFIGNCHNCGKSNHMAKGCKKLKKAGLKKAQHSALVAEHGPINIIRSDRGGEYVAPFEQICSEYGIIHQTTTPYSPQSNGVAECKNRTLKEMMNAMLINSGLPQNMWGEAVLTANHILNKIPPKGKNETPYEILVVKGFKQKEGYDFFDTYSPVTRIASIRVLLSIAALHNLEIHQMDVKTTFLN